MPAQRILLVEGAPLSAERLERQLGASGALHEICRVATLDQAVALLRQASFDVVVAGTPAPMDAPGALLSHFPGMAYRWVKDGTLTPAYVSPGSQDLTGYAPEELGVGGQVRYPDLIHPDDRDAVQHAVAAALDERHEFRLRYRIRTAAGDEKWVWEHGCGVFGEDGRLLAVEGIITDVGDHVRAEAALLESERRYRRLVESVTDYICTVHVSEGRAVETTHGPGCVAVTGYTSEDYAGDPFLWYRMVHEEDRPAVERHAAQALHGETTPFEHRIRHRDGSLRWVRNTPVPRFDERGTLVGYDALIADISDRKHAEAALADNERFLANVFACIQDGISVLDRELRIVRVNAAMERWYAHALPLAGRRCYEVYHGRTQPCEICPSRRSLDSGRAEHDVVAHEGPGGEVLGWQDLFSFPMHDPASGQVIGVIEYVRDISEARRAEAALKEKEEQLRQSHKMEAVGTLAGGVAHDFNNLLTAILGYADMLREQLPAEGPWQLKVEEITKAGNRAAALTRKLLAFSRKQVLSPRLLDLNTVVTDMGDMLRRLIAEDIELVFATAPGLVRVRADPGQIEQVVLNLVVNARDAMPDGGRLVIETRSVTLDESYATCHVGARSGPYAMLAVSDDGCGMDAQTRSHLFEPFFTTKSPGKGTGLGLATVYGIVKQSGGSIWVYSEVDRGTTVKVYLPLAMETLAADDGGSAQARTTSGIETILLVEDEEAIRNLIADILRARGYTVLEARNGREASRVLQDYSAQIHLLLTDVVMPLMSGRELAARAAALRPNIAVLYMSGYTDEAVVLHGVLQREAAFLQKPFTTDELARKVREVLERASNARPPAGPA